jgi:AcrR family transcriptional regulator
VTEKKSEKLRRILLNTAETRIKADGLSALRVRDVAKDSGYALGSLYNAFKDLDLLVIAVNSRTLKRLRIDLQDAVASTPDASSQMNALATAYLTFAVENSNLWAALFDHRMSEGSPVPDWHLEEHEHLIEEVMKPLASLIPNLSMPDLALRARTIFSAVHGIIKLSLEGRFVALDPEALRGELLEFLECYLRGMKSQG